MRLYLSVLTTGMLVATLLFYTSISSAQAKYDLSLIVIIPAILALPIVLITVQIIAGFLHHISSARIHNRQRGIER